MTTLEIVTNAQPIPTLGEIAILKERQETLLEIYKNDEPSFTQALEIINELAEIETALQRYDGTMDDIADTRREARFGCGL